jgi:PIN domain nuclease of toxin-antitoxin system
VLNLDMHILICAFSGDLTPREEKLLSSQRWSISAIPLWELAKLAQLGRIDLDIDMAELRDPADELICATSMVHQLPLLTRDQKMRKSSVVPLA